MLVVTESKLAWNQFEKEKIGLSTVISTPQMLVLKALWGTNGQAAGKWKVEEEERERAKQHIHNIYRSTRKGMLEETPKWKLRFDL